MTDDTSPRALVVDDNALIRMDAVDIIEEAGFRPLEAFDVERALTVLNTFAKEIQLLFTDVQMPRSRDGFALARECAKGWPHIKILVASGQKTPGPDDSPEGAVFVSKPFSAEVVHTRLVELLPDGQKPEPLKHARPVNHVVAAAMSKLARAVNAPRFYTGYACATIIASRKPTPRVAGSVSSLV